MRRKKYSALPVVLIMTLALVICAGLIHIINGMKEDEEPDHWQLASDEAVLDRKDGLSGLLFSAEDVLKTDGGWFGLVKDDDSGIHYAYVPAEMKGALHVFFDKKRSLRVEGDGVSGSFSSGDELPVFAEGQEYVFSYLDAEGNELESGTAAFLYTENVPSMYIDTVSGSMEAVDGDKKHLMEEEASYRIFQTDGAQDASGKCVVRGRGNRAQDASGKCVVRGRGNSTWSQAKKPYNLKLENENSLLGMDGCTKLALVSNYWDSSQTRQYYAFEMADRLGLAYTPQSRFVNVYLNGRYHSLCLLTQRINVNGGSVHITDLDEKNENANIGNGDPETVVMDTDEDDKAYGFQIPAGTFRGRV